MKKQQKLLLDKIKEQDLKKQLYTSFFVFVVWLVTFLMTAYKAPLLIVPFLTGSVIGWVAAISMCTAILLYEFENELKNKKE